MAAAPSEIAASESIFVGAQANWGIRAAVKMVSQLRPPCPWVYGGVRPELEMGTENASVPLPPGEKRCFCQ